MIIPRSRYSVSRSARHGSGAAVATTVAVMQYVLRMDASFPDRRDGIRGTFLVATWRRKIWTISTVIRWPVDTNCETLHICPQTRFSVSLDSALCNLAEIFDNGEGLVNVRNGARAAFESQQGPRHDGI